MSFAPVRQMPPVRFSNSWVWNVESENARMGKGSTWAALNTSLCCKTLNSPVGWADRTGNWASRRAIKKGYYHLERLAFSFGNLRHSSLWLSKFLRVGEIGHLKDFYWDCSKTLTISYQMSHGNVNRLLDESSFSIFESGAEVVCL